MKPFLVLSPPSPPQSQSDRRLKPTGFNNQFPTNPITQTRRGFAMRFTGLAVGLQSISVVLAEVKKSDQFGLDRFLTGVRTNKIDSVKVDEMIQILTKQRLQRPLSYHEELDLGICLMLKGRWDAAASSFENAHVKASNAGERLTALLSGSECLHILAAEKKDPTYNQQAGEMANLAQKEFPKDGNIACLRLKYWTGAKNKIEVQVAENKIKETELKAEGVEVLEPGTVVVICVGVAAAAAISYVAVKKFTADEIVMVLRELSVLIATIKRV